ncbi:DUF2530 domain-containing protein [Nakamurella leprariae]|uniref:DUF2530 domain-containing protein n=1 Tax=Nakamurella leprariae TaxID=2803911 RepID=A0A939C0U0_9ACTN|nr:DUF2530 domain-containing protein [Nakamurella leprariae]MBM9466389.1 DUF2530 domain-containing protein [Nakamurella leprariae]
MVQPERQPDHDAPVPTLTPPPPPLPPVRANLAHIVIPTTALWFVAFVVLLFFTRPLREHDAMIWLWTCLAGWVLGLMGLSIYFWQRHAARRGRRSANQMALDEQLR